MNMLNMMMMMMMMMFRKETCGYFTTRNHYVISTSKEYTDQVFEKLRNHGNYL